MKISAFADKNFKVPLKDSNKRLIPSYSFMINPDSIKLQQTFAPAVETDSKPNGRLSFEIVIDCTGVVDANRTDLPGEMSRIKTILYKYKGQILKPNFVKMEWGNHLSFYGVLTSLDTSYTLFKPDGTPLRVRMSFVFDQCHPTIAR